MLLALLTSSFAQSLGGARGVPSEVSFADTKPMEQNTVLQSIKLSVNSELKKNLELNSLVKMVKKIFGYFTMTVLREKLKH